MPISSTYRQTEGSNQPWNTTKSRRQSSSLPPSCTKNDCQSIRPLSSATNRSNSTKFSKQPQTRPAWVTGSFSLSKTNEGQCLRTLPIKGSPSRLSRRTLKRRETLPVFSELSFAPVPKLERSNSDSLLKPCELGMKRKFRRENSSQTYKCKRSGEKSATTHHKKVEPESKISPNNSKLCFNDYNQTPKELGQRVLCVLNKQIKSGVVHYLGSTHFSAGQWCGIVLDEPCGKNDGCVKGVRYFTCAENYGIFVHIHKVRTFDKPNFTTDGFGCKESEEALGNKTIPRSFKYSNTITMNSSEAAGSLTTQKDPLNDESTGLYPSKKRSNSLTDGANGLSIGSTSSKCNSNTDTTRKDMSRSRSLTEILDHRKDCNKCNEIDCKCNFNLHTDLNGIANSIDDSSEVVKQSKQCSKTKAEPSVSGELMTTTSTTSSNNDSLLNVITGSKGRRSYSSDYITSVALKSKHDLNSPGPHAALERNTTIDAFVQDKYCSCPNLVPSQHLSSALEACIDLGRQELETYSEKVTPVEEVQPSEFDDITESEQESSAENNELGYNSEKLPHHGRSKSLPLVLVQVRNISETNSLFWSTDKLSALMFKEERSASWPTLSTSACRLDLRTDNKIDANDGVNCGQEAKMINHELSENDESDLNIDKHESTKVFPLKKQVAVESLVQSDTESLSQSESQLSLSSVETTTSRKARKVSASSASSSRSQTRAKSQRNSKVNARTDDKSKNKRNTEVNPAPFKLTKRHTTGLQKYQTTTLSGTARPSMTKRPASTLTDASATVSPTYGKSKLPTMKKPPLSSSNKPASSKPVNKAPIRPASIALQDVKKLPGTTANQTAKDARSVSKTASQRKPSLPPSQKTTAKTDSTVKKRTQVTSKPGQQVMPATDRKVSRTTTKTTVANKPKPTTPQNTTGSPVGKAASSPSKPYHSRLPTRKIISRDGSIESSHSHERDIDTASIGTEESDYLEGNRLSRVSIDHYDADRSDLESSTKSWQYVPHAPDILTGTREIHRRSVEVQVELDDENAEDIKDKYVALERLLHGLKNDCRDLELAVGERDSSLLSSAILIAALCKKLQGNGRLIVHLKKDLQMTESELKQIQERLAEEEANAVKLQEEMMYVRSEHTVAIQNLKADHENTLEALRYSLSNQYAEEISKANDEHMKEMVELNKVHAEKEMEIKRHHQKDIADVSEKYKDEIVELESKHSQHIDELLEEHQVEIETIKSDYEEQHGGIESKLFAVTKECASLNMQLQQLQEDTERDIQSRIQEAIEKYKALPAELESMKAVLDMRNEENKQLKKERMEARMEVDHLRKVAERVKKLEHENESLSFVVENKSKYERQLSVEHEHLKTTLDRESKKLKRLSLENEELHWKLYQGSSPTEEKTSLEFPANGSPASPKRRSFRLSASSDVGTIDE